MKFLQNKKYCVFLILILSITSVTTFSNRKNAYWIVDKNVQSKSNSWIMFKKDFKIDKSFSIAMFQIAVDSKYWLWINGELIVFEGGLKRGPSPQDTYYDYVDLTPHLKEGENSISVLSWYFGKDGFSHNSSGKAGLYAELSLDNEFYLGSNDSWHSSPHPAYLRIENGKQPNFRLPESNVIFDARKDIKDWQTRKNSVRWGTCMNFGNKGCAPWNKLVKRPIPLWKDFGMKDYANQIKFPLQSNGNKIVCKLPYNCQFTPYFKIKAKAGLKVDLRTDNYMAGGTPNIRAEYITKDGVQEYESLGWINGHEMYYTFPEGVEVLDLKFRETGYDTELNGKFVCDDEFHNKLWKKAVRTLYVTMRDTYMDCPDRERAQWWGDEVNELGEAFYCLSPNSHLLAKKGIYELMNWQRESGVVFAPVPAGNWDKELPHQMLNSVGYYGFYTYMLNSGDTETIKNILPRVEKYLKVWEIGNNGLVKVRRDGWFWVDHGANKDAEVLTNAWYYLALKGFVLMSDAVGDTQNIVWAQKRMMSIKNNFDQTFWTGKEYRTKSYRGKTDDRANAMAVVSGLANRENFPNILKVLQNQFHSSPYFEKYVIEAMFMMGYDVEAMMRTKSRFKGMVENNFTTLTEGSTPNHNGFEGGTNNHAWSGGALTLYNEYLIGVKCTKLGFEEISIKPQMAKINKAYTKFETVKGFIEIENKINGKVFYQMVKTPNNTDIVLHNPKSEMPLKLTINGKELNYLKQLRKNGCVKLGGGEYEIEWGY
jgi:hypothetical protein